MITYDQILPQEEINHKNFNLYSYYADVTKIQQIIAPNPHNIFICPWTIKQIIFELQQKKSILVYNLTLLKNVSLPLILCCCKKAYFKHLIIVLFLFQLLLPLHWHFSCCLCVSTLLILARMEISKFTFQNTLLFYFIVTNIFLGSLLVYVVVLQLLSFCLFQWLCL